MMKRQTTRWLFNATYAGNTGIRVGYVYNKANGVREDVIRLQCKSLSCTEIVDLQMRVDEAVIIAAGLNKISGQMLIGQLRIPKGSLDIMSPLEK